MNEKKLKEIRETFEKAEKLLEEGNLPSEYDTEYIQHVHDTLLWVLGEYTQNPLEDY